MAALIPGKLLYLRSPHTASVATERAVMMASPDDAVVIVPGHCTVEEIRSGTVTSHDGKRRALDLLTGDELLVTTVRNPYEVIVTWWLRATRGEGSFAGFIREINRPPQVIDGRIFSRADECVVVMRYESLEGDWKALLSRLGLAFVPIPIENTTKGKAPWETYYDAESFEAVRERFGAEIEQLGYGPCRGSTPLRML